MRTGKELFLTVTEDLVCPRCGAQEVNEFTGNLNIRAFKVCDDEGVWHSQCLICEDMGYRDHGWFCTEISQ